MFVNCPPTTLFIFIFLLELKRRETSVCKEFVNILINKDLTKIININGSSRPVVFCRKGALRSFTKFTGKQLCQSLRPATLSVKKETQAQVFSCEFCEISKNTFFTEHLWWLLLDITKININISCSYVIEY